MTDNSHHDLLETAVADHRGIEAMLTTLEQLPAASNADRRRELPTRSALNCSGT